MRTLDEITDNIYTIQSSMRALKDQMHLLDIEYQKPAIEIFGKPDEEWTKMRDTLQAAWETLNQLWHMEADIEMDMKYSEEE